VQEKFPTLHRIIEPDRRKSCAFPAASRIRQLLATRVLIIDLLAIPAWTGNRFENDIFPRF
jgi:hypothetical protein